MLIIGNGYIGNLVKGYFEADGFEGKINSLQEAKEAVDGYSIVVNCAGYNDVDGCEIDKERALRDNTLLPQYLALACDESDTKLVQISTGCIFDGHASWHTQPNADSFYAKTKIMAEGYTQVLCSDVLIARIRLPFDAVEHPRELITKMLKMRAFHNEQNSYTNIKDFLWALGHLIKTDSKGTYNILNHGTLSPVEFAHIIKEYIDFDFETIDFKDISTPVRRVNVQMDTKELTKLGIPMRSIETALRDTLEARYGKPV